MIRRTIPSAPASATQPAGRVGRRHPKNVDQPRPRVALDHKTWREPSAVLHPGRRRLTRNKKAGSVARAGVVGMGEEGGVLWQPTRIGQFPLSTPCANLPKRMPKAGCGDRKTGCHARASGWACPNRRATSPSRAPGVPWPPQVRSPLGGRTYPGVTLLGPTTASWRLVVSHSASFSVSSYNIALCLTHTGAGPGVEQRKWLS